MARINLTPDQDEVPGLLGDDPGEAFREIPGQGLDAVLRAESDEQVGAAPYERSEGHRDRRNGTRRRSLVTRVGTIEPAMARPRAASVP